MAKLTIRGVEKVLENPEEISKYLSQYGIWYRRFEGSDNLSEDAESEEILAAYDAPIQKLKEEGGYVTADVINVKPDIEGLDAMLAKFSKEHWHDEDEVRFEFSQRCEFIFCQLVEPDDGNAVPAGCAGDGDGRAEHAAEDGIAVPADATGGPSILQNGDDLVIGLEEGSKDGGAEMSGSRYGDAHGLPFDPVRTVSLSRAAW